MECNERLAVLAPELRVEKSFLLKNGVVIAKYVDTDPGAVLPKLIVNGYDVNTSIKITKLLIDTFE